LDQGVPAPLGARPEGDAQNWTRLGAAWAHQDKKGFNLDVEMIPMKPGRFVVREAKPKLKGEGQ
jgi:hypothetical protein